MSADTQSSDEVPRTSEGSVPPIDIGQVKKVATAGSDDRLELLCVAFQASIGLWIGQSSIQNGRPEDAHAVVGEILGLVARGAFEDAGVKMQCPKDMARAFCTAVGVDLRDGRKV